MFAGFGGEASAKQCAQHAVYGDIGSLYNATGGSDGPLGCPTSDEVGLGNGRFNQFEFGQIVWSPNSGNGPHFTLAAWSEKGVGPISVQWSGYRDNNHTLVRWNLNGQNLGQSTLDNGGGGSYGVESTSIQVGQPGTYEIIAEFCNKSLFSSSDCGSWGDPVEVVVGAPGGAQANCTPTLAVAADMPNTAWHFSGNCFPRNKAFRISEKDDASHVISLAGFTTDDNGGWIQFTLAAACGPGMLHFTAVDDKEKAVSNRVDVPCPVMDGTISTKSVGGSGGGSGGALAGTGASQLVTSAMPGRCIAGTSKRASPERTHRRRAAHRNSIFAKRYSTGCRRSRRHADNDGPAREHRVEASIWKGGEPSYDGGM